MALKPFRMIGKSAWTVYQSINYSLYWNQLPPYPKILGVVTLNITLHCTSVHEYLTAHVVVYGVQTLLCLLLALMFTAPKGRALSLTHFHECLPFLMPHLSTNNTGENNCK